MTVPEAAEQMSKLAPRLSNWTKNTYIASSNLTSSQIISLMNLHEFKTCPVSKLAKALGVSLPTTSGIIDRLVKNKYIKRLYDEKDRRLVLISLTAKGEAIVQKILESIRYRWQELLAHLTDQERESYIVILKKLTSVISEEIVRKDRG